MKDAIASTRFLVRVAWSQSRRDAVAAFLEVVGLALQRLMPVWVGLLIGAVGTRDLTWAAVGAAGAAVSLGAGGLFVVWGVNSRLRMLDLVGHELDRELARSMAATPTLVEFSRPEVRETLQIIKDRLGALGGAYNSLVNALNGSVPPIASVVAAMVLDVRLGLLAVAGLLSVPHAWLSIRWEERAEEASAEHGVRSEAWIDATLGDGADELAAYGSAGWASAKALEATRGWRSPMARAESRANALGVAYDVLYAAAAAAVIWWVVSTNDGWAAAAVLVGGLLVAVDLREGFEGLRGSVEAFAQSLRTVTRYRQAVALLNAEPAEPAEPAPSGERATPRGGGIRLEGVSVTYPGSDAPAVADVNLDIPAGSVVAVVGENGAGKSTLVQALLGLLPPSAGTVTTGSVRLDASSARAWRDNASGVFQDFNRFGFDLGTSVGIGRLVHGADGTWRPSAGRAVESAVCDAGASTVVDDLPDGLDTVLGDDGQDLSGGQWQRVALARGLVRATPSLLVLDEPTSALDPHAERAVLDVHLARARAVAADEGITVVVTHRLSSVTSADLVVMMQGGALVEAGTHEELMAADGPYRELFDLHARDYQ